MITANSRLGACSDLEASGEDSFGAIGADRELKFKWETIFLNETYSFKNLYVSKEEILEYVIKNNFTENIFLVTFLNLVQNICILSIGKEINITRKSFLNPEKHKLFPSFIV